MKIYIFLTMCMGGISGNPSYINNKVKWLSSHGWKAFAFDSFFYGDDPIEYQDLRVFCDNRLSELDYHPMWLSKTRRKNVLQFISKKTNSRNSEEIVVESNSIILAEWGELLAEFLHAKHLVYIIGENVRIRDRETFNFLFFKYQRNELFSINAKAFESLFANFFKVEDAFKHFWCAKSQGSAEDVETDLFDNLPSCDYTITHFGRFKEYFLVILPDLINFANHISPKSILFLVVGNGFDEKMVSTAFEGCKNVQVSFYKAMIPIPKKLFQLSDVVIATAGCARISFEAGTKTISMDVENNAPLGVLGYTTQDTAFRNNKESNKHSVIKILKDILVEGKYREKPTLDIYKQVRDYGYDYQLSFIQDKGVYYDEELPSTPYGRLQKLDYVIVKVLGFIRLSKSLHILKSQK